MRRNANRTRDLLAPIRICEEMLAKPLASHARQVYRHTPPPSTLMYGRSTAAPQVRNLETRSGSAGILAGGFTPKGQGSFQAKPASASVLSVTSGVNCAKPVPAANAPPELLLRRQPPTVPTKSRKEMPPSTASLKSRKVPANNSRVAAGPPMSLACPY